MDILTRARNYLSKLDPSVSGNNGHSALFKAAIVLVKGFNLDESTALSLLESDFNPRCEPSWSSKDLIYKVKQAQTASSDKPDGYLLDSKGTGKFSAEIAKNSAIPPQQVTKMQKINHELIARSISHAYTYEELIKLLHERSPIDPSSIKTPEDYLSHIIKPLENILVFTSERSQGDFGFRLNADGEPQSFQLGERKGTAAQPASLPTEGRTGVWYLCQPVTGKWQRNGQTTNEGLPKLSRRSANNVTDFRHMLLESDELKPELWLTLITQFKLPITAIYTSGKRSVHVLMKVNAKGLHDFKRIADKVAPVFAKFGADPGAISSVRLTRLPCCLRLGNFSKTGEYTKWNTAGEQRLLYLNPNAAESPLKAINTLTKIRNYENSEN